MFRKKLFRQKQSRRATNRRPQLFSLGRSLRYEKMEGRLVLSASGFTGNECAPEIDDVALDAIVPSESFSPQSEIAFQFSADAVVSDAGVGATAPADILFALDPDIGFRDNGATPVGATLTFNDQGNTDASDDTWDFSWTPSAAQVGRFRLFLIATDDGGTGNVPLSDVYSFQFTVDNRPSVDLNGTDQNGINADAVSFTEADGSTPVSLVDSDLFIFSGNSMIESATVEIVDPQADGLEVLAVTADASLVVDDSTPGRLVITVAGGGLADKALFEAALSSLTYNNTSDAPEVTRTINVTVNDGTQESAIATAIVNITATNDTPDLRTVPGAPNAKVGEEYVLDLVATDPDGSDLLVFRITSGPASAVISPNGLPDDSSDNTIQVAPDASGLYRAQIRWTPSVGEGEAGSAFFTVAATDRGGLADAEFYEIGIENQEPVANDDPSPESDPLAVGEDAGDTVLGNILANDTDADGDSFIANSVSAGGSTFAVGAAFTHPTSGAEILVAATGQVNYNPNGQFESLAAGETTTDTFQYTILDENGNESGQATVTVTINGVNDEPVASNVAAAAVENGPAVDGNFAGNDLDDGETATLSYAITSQPSEGTVGNNDDGTFTFDPGDDFQDLAEGITREVSFDYTATDDQAVVSDAAIATITVTGVNDTPTIDISNDTGIPSVLPTGSFESPGRINVELDLSSSDPNINSLNLIDIPSFTADADNDTLILSLASGDNGGTPFPDPNNRPELNASDQLVWAPTATDIGTGYVIRVQAEDNPAGGNPLSTSIDMVVSVVAANPPEVESVSDIDVSLDVSEVTILFNEAMGASAFVVSNYSLRTVDGSFPVDSSVSILTATQSGDKGVILQLSDPTITTLSEGGVTKLRLTFNPAIADPDGNTLGGALEFDLDLIAVLP